MPRMTLLDGSFWVSLSAPRGPSGAAKAEAGYPPYNVELLPGEPEALRITLAVAGFAPDQLEVSTESGELSIRGKQNEEQPHDFLHRGIAARQFKRSFRLARGVEVRKAELHNGLLVIELVGPREAKRVMRIGVAAAD
jgi:HSP20 family molecular chaperone IbpA